MGQLTGPSGWLHALPLSRTATRGWVPCGKLDFRGWSADEGCTVHHRIWKKYIYIHIYIIYNIYVCGNCVSYSISWQMSNSEIRETKTLACVQYVRKLAYVTSRCNTESNNVYVDGSYTQRHVFNSHEASRGSCTGELLTSNINKMSQFLERFLSVLSFFYRPPPYMSFS